MADMHACDGGVLLGNTWCVRWGSVAAVKPCRPCRLCQSWSFLRAYAAPGLFFITTGFSIDLRLAIGSWRSVVGMALGLHVLKTLVVAAVCLAFRLKLSVAVRSGLLLSQGGEFAFVIFALAQQVGLLAPAQVKLLLTAVVMTMFLTPFLNDIGAKASSRMERRSGKILLPSPDEAEPFDYVLICGFGRVGQAVAEMLTAKLVRVHLWT